MERAHFLKLTALGALGISLAPTAFLQSLAAPLTNTKKLVLLELQGGNDGLNTLIPYADEHYYRLRPKLALPRDKVMQFNTQQGLHPAMKALWPRWQKKQWAWIQNVGYPQPNRSHFRSIEIWETGSDANTYKQTGWLAESLPHFRKQVSAGLPLEGILSRADTSGPFAGNNLSTLSTAEVFRFAHRRFKTQNTSTASTQNAALAHIQALGQQKNNLQKELYRLLHPSQAQFKHWRERFPKTPIGRELADVACCILGGLPTPTYKITLKGFDTHRGQARTHWRLLKDLSDALEAFARVLETEDEWKNTLVMSYSEFGRRPSENGSKGTDHGTAAPHFALGGSVKGGLYGKKPDLSLIRNSRHDLKHSLDYRQLYSTIIQKWWHQPLPQHLKKHTPLTFI